MSIADDFSNAVFALWVADLVAAGDLPPLPVTRPPTREETIKEAWRLSGDRFDYERGWMIVRHDLGIVPDIRFELIHYDGQMSVIEAEGTVVAKFPKIG
jgi:hypothetical protein